MLLQLSITYCQIRSEDDYEWQIDKHLEEVSNGLPESAYFGICLRKD
jgi:hypothetical protein